jgi:hypothetical protein
VGRNSTSEVVRFAGRRVVLLAFGSCDGDGCKGGPNGPASKFCQDAIDRTLGVDSAMVPARICKSCCIQEVRYKGEIENGKCICRR